MSYRVHITADVDTMEEAEALLGDLNEAVGKNDADLMEDGFYDLDDPEA